MGSHVPLAASLPCKETVVSSILIGSTNNGLMTELVDAPAS